MKPSIVDVPEFSIVITAGVGAEPELVTLKVWPELVILTEVVLVSAKANGFVALNRTRKSAMFPG